MAMIPNEIIQRIKHQVNIVDLIDQFVALKKRGKNHFGFCPFHDERTPSFSVSEEKQIYKCFSCGRAGNVFSFFMEKDGLTFVEAVKEVAELGNVPVDIHVSDQIEREKSPEQLVVQNVIAMHQLAVEFYHHILLHTLEGKTALTYLLERGFTKETIETFKIGVSPAQRHLLVTLLKNQGYSEELIQQSGLVSQYQDTLLDRFSNRIMFPLRNDKGEYVAFSGRVYLNDESRDTSEFKEPKYLNSPETKVFNKGSFLFNLDLARPTIRKTSEFMLCEGFMDVLATWQAGITNSVASMGTSLTVQQIQQLKRLGNKVIIAYDGDEAGQKATDRAIQLLRQARDISIYVLPMLDNMDPDELIQAKGSAYFLEHVKHEQETDFAFYKRFYRQHDALDSQRSQLDYVDMLLKELLHVSSITARSMYIKELSEEFNIAEEALQKQFDVFARETAQLNRQQKQASQLQASIQIEQSTKSALTKRQKAEKQLLKRLLTQEDTQRIIAETHQTIEFSTASDQELYLLFLALQQSRTEKLSSLEWLDMFQDNLELRNRVADLMLSEFDECMSDQEIIDLLSVMDKDDLRKIYQQKRKEYAEAQKANDEELMISILQELTELAKKMK
ncbi:MULTISPECIES: DNA primase [unclassified Granulicatella]|uniref:DNA primase n=1 Tax=unclassified Granulicatella TaxID=2630493 RepID=UPI0010744008|nr:MULTISPECIES: DNA primase [unclassified Granulicatella]MBF0781045.1 DNA primase [Granulicatella sp. 19428wC4_WM01]TFU92447.1 DNA primase [Granulicatella sp. WM01]